MDPSSPAGSAPRRPDETGTDVAEEAYDGYDGRYARAGGGPTVLSRPEAVSAPETVSRPEAPAPEATAVPETASAPGATAATPVAPTRATPVAPTRATPVAPTRRRRRAADAAPDGNGTGDGAADGTRVTTDRGGRRGRPSGPRRVGVGILVGAFLMFAVAALDSVLGAEVPVLGSFASSGVPPRAEEPPPLPPPPDTAGTCLNWERSDATDTAAVNCAQPHKFEQAGRVELADQPVFPSDEAWQTLVSDRCTPVVTRYLDNKFDPDGKFRVGALKPSQARWDEGDRGMRCGLQTASRSGSMLPITGKVAEQDQSAVQQAGTCLAIDGRTVGDPTGCGGPHAAEVVGVVDLGTEFPEEFPAVEDQDEFLQPACTTAANEFAGNDKVIGEKGLTVYWGNLSEESWKAGSRKVNCNIGTLLPDGSGFASLTGSVKGNLVVAGQSAPPAATPPGAPSAPGSPAAPTGPADPAAPSAPADGSAEPSGRPGSEQPTAPGAPPTPDLDIPPGLPGLGDD
ncbi:septum formation family protein [Pseudonocardia ammonioxydans]|nr:septum formation family protein [Pseudonocardia ammonioxydans]